MEPGIARRRIRELEFMVPEFVDRPGGSKRVQAQPARRQQVDVGPADLPARRQEKRRRARNNNRQLT